MIPFSRSFGVHSVQRSLCVRSFGVRSVQRSLSLWRAVNAAHIAEGTFLIRLRRFSADSGLLAMSFVDEGEVGRRTLL